MRWTLLIAFGVALVVAGVAGLGLEVAHGSNIWRKGNGGVAPLVVGGLCIWGGLSERGSGRRNKPLGPALIWLAVVIAIGVILYALAPPLAFLYAVIVGIAVRFSLVANWLDRE